MAICKQCCATLEFLAAGKRVIAAWLNSKPGGNIVQIAAELADLRAAIAKATKD